MKFLIKYFSTVICLCVLALPVYAASHIPIDAENHDVTDRPTANTLEEGPIVTSEQKSVSVLSGVELPVLTEGNQQPDQQETPVIIRKEKGQRRVLGVKIPRIKPVARMERDIRNYLYVPKRTWAIGLNVSYHEENLDNYEFVILENFRGRGHIFTISPFFCYFFRDNTGVGARFSYQNTTIRIDRLDFDLGEDASLDIRNLYLQERLYTGSVFIRTYIGLGKNKRFGLFNDAVLGFAGGSGQLYSGRNAPDVIKDTRQNIYEINLGIKPGLSVFILDNVCVEASVSMLGVKFRRTEQYEQGERVGFRNSSKMNFKADILSLNLGLSVYM